MRDRKNMISDIVWESKYRPNNIDDCILPADTKARFKNMVAKGEFPNMLLSGPAGTGKTTAARALCEELDYELLIINGSNEGRLIDTLRSKITNFASQLSLSGQSKCVLIDEADYLPQESIQPALRNFMDEFTATDVKFIFTCNFPNKIIEPLHSRCAVVDFKIPKDESMQLKSEAAKRIRHILKQENIKVENVDILLKMVHKYFPDMRRLINEIQYKTTTGALEVNALSGVNSEGIVELSKILSEKNAAAAREWIAEQPYLSVDDIAQDLHKNMYNICSKETMPQFILTIAEWLYKSKFMGDREIATAAMLVDLMLNTEIRKIGE